MILLTAVLCEQELTFNCLPITMFLFTFNTSVCILLRTWHHLELVHQIRVAFFSRFHSARLCRVGKAQTSVKAKFEKNNNKKTNKGVVTKILFVKLSLKFTPEGFPTGWRRHCKQSGPSQHVVVSEKLKYSLITGTKNNNRMNISSHRFDNTVLGTRYQNMNANAILLFRQYMKRVRIKT